MGKASKLLTLLVHPDLDGPEIVELRAKGHAIVTMEDHWDANMMNYDLILGPNCWQMTPDLLKYLPLAVRAARERKYPAKEKV